MRTTAIVLGALVAGALAAAAALAHKEFAAALTLATLAVLVGAAVLVLAVGPSAPGATAPTWRSLEITNVREWLRGGALGHEEVVRTLDRIDRMGAHPTLAVRSGPEMEALRAMSPAEFLAWVDRRLDEIEGVP